MHICIDTTRKTRNNDEFTLNCRPTVSVGQINNETDPSRKGLAPRLYCIIDFSDPHYDEIPVKLGHTQITDKNLISCTN
jgi:hypothetical protein